MTSRPDLLRVESLSVRFGGVTAVQSFDLELAPRQSVGLIGPNGAGKSTVMNLISGHTRPASGRISFRGHDITGLTAAGRARLGVARTFQNLELFGSLSVLDNVLLGCGVGRGRRSARHRSSRSWRRGAALSALERMHICDYASEPARSIPYGVAKLVELSRALVAEPPLLLLDEPVAGLSDAETHVKIVLDALSQLDTAVVIVEHDMPTVRQFCESVVVLDAGGVIARGSFDEVARDPKVVEAYLGSAAP